MGHIQNTHGTEDSVALWHKKEKNFYVCPYLPACLWRPVCAFILFELVLWLKACLTSLCVCARICVCLKSLLPKLLWQRRKQSETATNSAIKQIIQVCTQVSPFCLSSLWHNSVVVFSVRALFTSNHHGFAVTNWKLGIFLKLDIHHVGKPMSFPMQWLFDSTNSV